MYLLEYLKPIVITGIAGVVSLVAGMTVSIWLVIILVGTAVISYLWYNVELPDPSANQPTYDPEFVRERTARWTEPGPNVKARRELRPHIGTRQSQSVPPQSSAPSASDGDEYTSDDDRDSEPASLSLSELEFQWTAETDVSFEDVGGMANIKQELQRDVVRPLTTHREQAARLGVSAASVIFHGPPGTGKTHLAQAVASEIGFPIAVLSGADIQSKWINESAQKVQSLFAEAGKVAEKQGGAVIFIDELDTVLQSRGRQRSHEEDSKVVNEFLTHLESTDDHDIVFIGATNRLNALDDAGIRPGRIDKTIQIGLPDMATRREIVRVQLSDRPNTLTGGHLDQIAGWTNEYTAADIQQIVDNAARSSLARNDDKITWLDIRRVMSVTSD